MVENLTRIFRRLKRETHGKTDRHRHHDLKMHEKRAVPSDQP